MKERTMTTEETLHHLLAKEQARNARLVRQIVKMKYSFARHAARGTAKYLAKKLTPREAR
jgi:hypothetical protein